MIIAVIIITRVRRAVSETIYDDCKLLVVTLRITKKKKRICYSQKLYINY